MGTIKSIFNISIPHTWRDYFDYEAGPSIPPVGARVWVPFRQGQRMGIVVGNNATSLQTTSLKTITEIIDEKPLLTNEVLMLCRWVSTYYQAPLSEVIALALPKKYREGKKNIPSTQRCYSLQMEKEAALLLLSKQASKQRALITHFHSLSLPKEALLRAGFNQRILTSLVEKGILFEQEQSLSYPTPPTLKPESLLLNGEQSAAADTVQAHLKGYHAFLLQGVTGSGKTEVYLQVISQVLLRGQQALVLVPEIGLTPQLLSRFQARFTEPMVVIHSNLTDKERQLAWQQAHEGTAKLVIGTRTAVFTSMPKLGLIVIDEEHDASFKQMEGVRYSARDTALMRAHTANIPIILGSATPSLESIHNVHLHKYTLLRLNYKALNRTPLRYQLVDLRHQSAAQGLAAPTLALIETHLAMQQQVLIFINRRGFAPILLCHQCGWMADCRACDAHLTLHQTMGKLMCHHCGRIELPPKQCPGCQSFAFIPVGIGTQRVFEYLKTVFPSTHLLRIDKDEVRKKNTFNEQLEKIHTGEAQLIVGTQMLAKGHHFPRLTLAVILDVDHGLYHHDYRALEQLGQLVTQVAGRAGRASHPGTVVIQTHLPSHPMLTTLIEKGYDAFANALLISRKKAAFPPYSFLAIIRAQGKQPSTVLSFLHIIKSKLMHSALDVLGPAPAPLARKAHQHRFQLLVKSPSRKQLRMHLSTLRDWISEHRYDKGIRWNIDVDPIDLS